jgi:hypothetical protein
MPTKRIQMSNSRTVKPFLWFILDILA